jgi:predicted MFS family arabinose efflux permease
MSRAQSYFTIVVICLMMIVLNMDANVMSPTLAAIEHEFGIGDAAIGSMMGLFTIIGALVSLFWGYFADKASRKALFIIAILIGEIPCTLTAFAPDYTVFFILRILSGVGLGAAYPLLYSIVGDMFGEKERPGAVAIVTVAVSVGTICGTLVGGYLGGGGNWRTPFIVASAPNFLFVLVYWLFTPEPKKAASEEATRELVAKASYTRRDCTSGTTRGSSAPRRTSTSSSRAWREAFPGGASSSSTSTSTRKRASPWRPRRLSFSSSAWGCSSATSPAARSAG